MTALLFLSALAMAAPKEESAMLVTRNLIDLPSLTPASVEGVLKTKLRKDPDGEVYRAESIAGPWKSVECRFPREGGGTEIRLEYRGRALTEKEIVSAFGHLPRLPGNLIASGGRDFVGFLISGKDVRWTVGPNGYAEEMAVSTPSASPSKR
jgi:hypothetical protein